MEDYLDNIKELLKVENPLLSFLLYAMFESSSGWGDNSLNKTEKPEL